MDEFSFTEQGFSNATPGARNLLIDSMIFIQSVVVNGIW